MSRWGLGLTYDNSTTFPFRDNLFDAVVMNRGLCECRPDTSYSTCGGIPLSHSDAKSFLREVIRVLNKNNPKATAFLLGSVAHTLREEVFWNTVGLDVMRENGSINIESVHYKAIDKGRRKGKNKGVIFIGLKISVRLQPGSSS